ncbi:MAG: hypothetical protein GXZ08_02665 [Tissierellia bacterium]|nr:hypothetical protein [Tissierellia bacterium]
MKKKDSLMENIKEHFSRDLLTPEERELLEGKLSEIDRINSEREANNLTDEEYQELLDKIKL